jgi:hypothetical protein
MKRLALVFLAGISFATVNAQFQFGIKAGANFANVNGDGLDGASTSTLTGFNGGVYFKLPLAPHVAIQPELVYSGQGFKTDVNTGTATVTVSQHANYFNIPVLLKYTHFTGLFLETGPQLGFLMSANEKAQGISQDDKSSFNSAEFAWVFGVGFKIPTTQLSIDARYNLGISNVINNDNNSSSNGGNTVHNGVFQIGLMYTLFRVPTR